MTPNQLFALRKWARTKDGKKLTQDQASAMLELSQGAISRAEDGALTLASERESRYIKLLTPRVLFIGGDQHYAEFIASFLITIKKQEVITEAIEGFYDLLRTGKDIVVITNDKTPFLKLIEKAITESGLPKIPYEGVKILDNSEIHRWD